MLSIKRLRWGVLLVVVTVSAWGMSYLMYPTADQVFDHVVSMLRQGDLVRAEKIAQEYQELLGSTEYERPLRGGLLVHAGLHQQALRYLTPEDAVGKARESVLVWAGECFFVSRDLARAEMLLRNAVAEFPSNLHAVRLLAAVYFDLGAMQLALAQLQTIQAFDPNDFRSFHTAGVIYLDFEQFDLAVANLETALERKPPPKLRAEISLDLSHAYRRLLKYNNALALSKSTNPSPRAFAEIALSQLGLGQLDDAEKSVIAGRRFESSDPMLLRAEALVLIEQRKFDDASIVLMKLTELEPHEFDVYYKLANVYRQLGRDSEHQQALARFEELKLIRERVAVLNHKANQLPYDADIRHELADLCHQMGRFDLEHDWRNAAAACKDLMIIRFQQPIPVSAVPQK